MSESCKEDRPLLCEDISDEELHQFKLQQRRYIGYRGKANNSIKGAAAIIRKWPDHVSSSITYWWAGLGMFALLVFITYNTAIYAMFPEVFSEPTVPQYIIDKRVQPLHKLSLPDIFVHVIVNNEKEANLDKYLPYIEIISNDNLQYKFNLIVLFNDTSQEKSNRQAKLNNEDALNSLWSANNINEINTTPNQKKPNIKIQHMNLSSYLNDSPLRNYWKHLSYQFIELMVRAVSIWNKGGIVFNPIILTPRSPHAVYIEKLQNILQTYEQISMRKVPQNAEQYSQNTQQKNKRNGHKHQNRKKVNNIRDIIEALETDNVSQSEIETLSVAENRQEISKVEIKPLLNRLNNIVDDNDDVNVTIREIFHDTLLKKKEIKPLQLNAEINDLKKNATEKSVFLPLFFDFLFRSKSEELMQKPKSEHILKRSSISLPTDSAFEINLKDDIIQPMIIPAPTEKSVQLKTEENFAKTYEDEDKLTIDLKGNILSTGTPCHAFIGSLFNHVRYCKREELLKDFIISELSLFCKGTLSACKGIDVILV